MAVTLEDELVTRARKSPEADDLCVRYRAMKQYLEKEYYPWIQANCPFYTDHGEPHIRSVIQAASLLLSPHLSANRRKSELTDLDLFLVLTSILWHDVGNVYGRSGHATKIAEMTREVKQLGFPNPNVHRLVNEIALAHAGENGLDMPREREDCTTSHGSYIVYPLALAAVVRFADEISENQSRISHAMMDKIPDENRVYWEYAKCISASIPDPGRQRIRITLNISIETATSLYPCPEYSTRTGKSEATLVEYIIFRLEKMNNERAYCAPHFSRYVTIREIEASLTLTRNEVRVDSYEELVTLGDGGVKQSAYPTIEVFAPFFRDHPRWSPTEIQKAAKQ